MTIKTILQCTSDNQEVTYDDQGMPCITAAKTTRFILNLTQHPATPEQVDAGVFEPANKAEVQALLTFDAIPHPRTLHERALALTEIAIRHNAWEVMIGGAPYLMGDLEIALENAGIKPLYSFSQRVSEEVAQPDGSVVKTNVFKHIGFVGEHYE